MRPIPQLLCHPSFNDPDTQLNHTATAQASQALTYDELQGLTYLQVKGSGIANTCPVLEGGSSNLKDLKPGSYNMSKFCLEPTSFTVKEESQFKGGEPEFVKTKLMTRLTYTLDEVGAHLCSPLMAHLRQLEGLCIASVHSVGTMPLSRDDMKLCGTLLPDNLLW